MRYAAHTIDGSVVYIADTAQVIYDAVCYHIEQNRRPHIAYTYDTLHGQHFPYATCKVEQNHYVFTPHKTFDEVLATIRQ